MGGLLPTARARSAKLADVQERIERTSQQAAPPFAHKNIELHFYFTPSPNLRLFLCSTKSRRFKHLREPKKKPGIKPGSFFGRGGQILLELLKL